MWVVHFALGLTALYAAVNRGSGLSISWSGKRNFAG